MATRGTDTYYDIMIMGMTGQGKSTTADKLLIANTTGRKYLGEAQEDAVVVEKKLKMSDLSLWCLSAEPDELERANARIKNIVYFRSLKDPHEEISNGRDGEMATFDATGSCELISNETTMVRVLDVPGFFGKNDYTQRSRSSLTASVDAETSGLRIMRNIIQIQTTMGMKFRRILYFLPVRGALIRKTDVVKMELQWMSHFFGEDILKCMVLVATVSTEYSKEPSAKFTDHNVQRTLRNFTDILKEVFPGRPTQVPPLIFLSLSETCESALEKVKTARVHLDTGLLLQFDSNTCANCGLKVGSKNNEKLACCFGQDWSTALPYKETLCHPVFVPKHSVIKKIVNRIVYVVTLKWARGVKFVEIVLEEACGNCGRKPSSRGCMKVGTVFDLKEQGQITVDHTSEMTRVIKLSDLAESVSITPQTTPAPELNQSDTSTRVEHVCVQLEPHQPLVTGNAAAAPRAEDDWNVKG